MKFSNGCWLQKEGTECFSPAQVYDYRATDKELRLLAPTKNKSWQQKEQPYRKA